MPPYFVIQLGKEEERLRREKIESLYLHPSYIHMKRELQSGKIIEIGKSAHEFFPEAKKGDMLLHHHFISGKVADNKDRVFLIDEDEEYDYYVVPAFYTNGNKNLSYGVWNGKELIPNKEYIFLEIPKSEESDLEQFNLKMEGMPDIVTNVAFATSQGGLVIPKAKKKTREQLMDTMTRNKLEIKKLSRWLQVTPEKVIPVINQLEKENIEISKIINKQSYELHTIAACNPQLSDCLGYQMKAGDTVYMLNIACHTRIEFLEKEYIISETKYISAKPEKNLEYNIQ